MKPGILVAISALLNVVLLLAVAMLWNKEPAARAPKVVTQKETNTVLRVVTKLGTDTNSFKFGSNIWRGVESADYTIYIKNMRAIGCPEETIRDIIITDINKLYCQKARAINPAASNPQFWMHENTADTPQNRAVQRQLKQLDREKRDLTRALLNADYDIEMAKQTPFPPIHERRLAFLAEGKRSQLQSINDKYGDLEQDIFDKANGAELTPEQKAALRELQKQRRAEIAGLLSPEELAEYEIRNSDTAQDLRYRMGAFSGSEDDFRNIFKLQKDFDDRMREAEAAGTLNASEKELARKTLEQEMKTLLGDRFAEYQKTTDAGYRDIFQTAQRNNLPKETAATVYDMKKAAEDQRRLLLADDTLTEEQKSAAFEALHAETQRAIKEAMGEKAFNDYQKQGGNWLQNLGEFTPKPVENR